MRSITSAEALLCAILVLAPAPALAQSDFPKQAVKLVVPFPPGGPTDTVGRLLAQKLQEAWGQPVVLDYSRDRSRSPLRPPRCVSSTARRGIPALLRSGRNRGGRFPPRCSPLRTRHRYRLST